MSSRPKKQFACGLEFPQGTSRTDRILCWKMVKSINLQSNLIVACSGGIDSTVLSHIAHKYIKLHGNKYSLTLSYVNHNLRPYENGSEIQHVIDLSRKLGAEYVIFDKPVGGKTHIQEKAREGRYSCLFDLGQLKAQVYLLTAHNANDQAETVLFRTLTGRKNVKIPEHIETEWGGVYRPLLKFTREEIKRYATVFNLDWCEDSSNSTDKYTRNKIRHHLVPWVENNINPNVVKILARDDF